jgi:hypothetical protein
MLSILDGILVEGGEGIILRMPKSMCDKGRSLSLLKMKVITLFNIYMCSLCSNRPAEIVRFLSKLLLGVNICVNCNYILFFLFFGC